MQAKKIIPSKFPILLSSIEVVWPSSLKSPHVLVGKSVFSGQKTWFPGLFRVIRQRRRIGFCPLNAPPAAKHNQLQKSQKSRKLQKFT
jgi:hypothetical protein